MNNKNEKEAIEESFLKDNSELSSLDLPNLRKVDDNFLSDNISLENLNLSKDLSEILSDKTEEKQIGRGRR